MSVHVGNAGEYFVMSQLLWRGCNVGLADRGNPTFDLLVRTKSGGFRAIRVKTSSAEDFKWTAKDDRTHLPNFDPDVAEDWTVLIAFKKKAPGKDTETYVMPTKRLVADIDRVHQYYFSQRNRDGSSRTPSLLRVIRLDGVPKEHNIAYGFRNEWREFEDAWSSITD